MTQALEDEFGDILEKARDGKNWSQDELAREAEVPVAAIRRMERYEIAPSDDEARRLAGALDLDFPSLLAIARGEWSPAPVTADPGPFDMVSLDLLMGSYPVKCYLVSCRKTGATALIDTAGSPRAVIGRARALGVRPAMICSPTPTRTMQAASPPSTANSAARRGSARTSRAPQAAATCAW